MYFYGPMEGNDWGFGIFSLLWLLFIGFVIYAFIRWIRHSEVGHKDSYTPTNPLDIARERYAKGEITKEQFEQLKKDLK